MSDPLEFLVSMFPGFSIDILRAAFDENNHQIETTVEYLLNYKEIPQPSPDKINIIVKTLTGRTHAIEVSPNTTSNQLQEKVSQLEGVPTSMQYLVFAGRYLPYSIYRPVGQPLPSNSNLKALGIPVPVLVHIPKLKIARPSTPIHFTEKTLRCLSPSQEDSDKLTDAEEVGMIEESWHTFDIPDSTSIQQLSNLIREKLKLHISTIGDFLAYNTFVEGKRSPWFMKVDSDFLYLHENSTEDATWADHTGNVQKYISVQRPVKYFDDGSQTLHSLGLKHNSTVALILNLRGD